MNKETWYKIQQGDHEAFGELYYEYVDLLYGYGMKITPNKEAVGEYIQSLFIDLWTHSATINYPQRMGPYLIVSLRNKMMKGIKQGRSSNVVNMDINDIEYGFELVPDIHETLVRTEMDAEQIKELENGLNRLTAREREVVYLKYYKNMSADDIAIIMRVKTQCIYNLTSQAIKKLRENMILEKAFLMAVVCLFKDL